MNRQIDRRDFLRLAGLAPLLLTAPRLFAAGAVKPVWERVLVLVELQGGNDGLNTVVPYADPRYTQLRPRLGVARDSVLKLSDQIGFNPNLDALMPIWNDRQLAIALGVGYTQPNRSHFRSIEIWETAADSSEVLQEGWLARLFADSRPPSGFVADGVVVGRDDAGPLSGPRMRNVIMQSPAQFAALAARVREASSVNANPALAHLLRVQGEVSQAGHALAEKQSRTTALKTAFPASRIGTELKTVAQLLVDRTAAPVFKVAHGSFDTHSNQRNLHDRLLKELAEALAAFRTALREAGLWERVLVLTYSEFGRRASENGSAGTDHGTAAPHFLIGGRVKGGLYGAQPSLTDLADGDLRHKLDYRSLYATVAKEWWGLPGRFSNRDYPTLNCIS